MEYLGVNSRSYTGYQWSSYVFIICHFGGTVSSMVIWCITILDNSHLIAKHLHQWFRFSISLYEALTGCNVVLLPTKYVGDLSFDIPISIPWASTTIQKMVDPISMIKTLR